MNEQNQLLNVISKTNKSEIEVIGDNNFQIKLIKIILDNDDNFSEQIIDIIKAEYFDNIHIKILFSYILSHIQQEKYKLPDYDILRTIINKKEPNGIQKTHLFETIDSIQKAIITDRAYIQNVALEFCRKQSVKNGILKAAQVWETGDYDSIVSIITESIRAGDTKDMGHDYLEDVEKRLGRDRREVVPALKGLDAEIGGGLGGGELGVVLSPTGGGKSMVLVKFATNAFKNGKNVVYYTLELKEKIIGNRIDSCLFNLELTHIPEFSDIIKERIKKYKTDRGRLFIKEFPTGVATVNTIRNHIKILERDNNFKPDIIIVDYADIMKSTSSYSERRYNLTNIYEGLRGVAMEFNIPVWTACQSNRESIDSEYFDLKSISESLGKAQTADIVVGLARTNEDKKNKKASLIVLKNRQGRDGFIIPLYFDTAKIDIRHMENSKNFSGFEKKAHDVELQALNQNNSFEYLA